MTADLAADQFFFARRRQIYLPLENKFALDEDIG